MDEKIRISIEDLDITSVDVSFSHLNLINVEIEDAYLNSLTKN